MSDFFTTEQVLNQVIQGTDVFHVVIEEGDPGAAGTREWADAANLDIDTGGTSQQLFAANDDRAGVFFQNLSSENMWINIGAAANPDKPSIRVAPDTIWTMPPGQIDPRAIHVVSATSGSKFSAKEYS